MHFVVLSIAAVSTTSIVKLPVSLEMSEQIETNVGAQALNQVFAEFPHVRTGLVLEDSCIVAEYVQNGINASELWYIWSVTKRFVDWNDGRFGSDFARGNTLRYLA